LVLLGGWCGDRRRPVCPAAGVGGGGTIPRSRAQVCGVFPAGRAHVGCWPRRGTGAGRHGVTLQVMRSSSLQPGSLLLVRDTEHHRLQRHSRAWTIHPWGVASCRVMSARERYQTTDLAVGGFESLAARYHCHSSAACGRGRCFTSRRNTATEPQPTSGGIPKRLRPQSPLPAAFLLTRTTVEAQPVVDSRRWPLSNRRAGQLAGVHSH
jgi:hypothetical protein